MSTDEPDLNHRILVAHREPERSDELRAMLERIGHAVIGLAHTLDEVVTAVQNGRPDVIVASLRLRDGDSIQALVDASRDQPIPSIIVTPRSDLESVERALDDHVMAYLVEPVADEDLRPTIRLVMARFEQFLELQREVVDLKQTLETRKTIEKAKGLLMRRRGIGEAEAFRLLQRTANNQRRKMAEVAAAVLLADGLLDGQATG